MAYVDLIIVISGIVLAGVLFFAAGYAHIAASSKWKLLYILPGFLCMALTGLSGFEISMLPAYIACALFLTGFFRESKRIRQAASILALLLLLINIPICLFYPGYRAPKYTKDFKKGFSEIKKHYVLTDYKGIDWDGLYEAYLPAFWEADMRHDEVGINILWQKFCQEFHDGHVVWAPADFDVEQRTAERMFGSDYGLSLMTLENKSTVAVNVEEGSIPWKAGIANGTVITEWNGECIDEVIENTDIKIASFPSAKNEQFYKALTAAGVGEESVKITFLDADGSKQCVDAPRIGTYAARLTETVDIINRGIEADNLSWITFGDDTACLRIRQMMYDNISYSNGDHNKMKEELRGKLLELSNAGTDKLIIDLRNNSGGSPHFAAAVAQLLAPKGEHEYIYEAVWDNARKEYCRDESGKYIVGQRFSYYGEDLWNGREIVVLVNAATISAGDHLTMLLSRFDNVKVMGFTQSNSSGQGINSIRFDYGVLTYSDVPCLTSDGDIFIDTDASGNSVMPLDVKVPFDEKAVRALFDENRDIVLEYALDEPAR